jgi:hypothetical protein
LRELFDTASSAAMPKTKREIMIASLRYLDNFAKIDRCWHFAERKRTLDWSETRSVTTPAAG